MTGGMGGTGRLVNYDDVANAPKVEGWQVWVTGTGPTTPAGVYQYDGASYSLVAVSGVNGQEIHPSRTRPKRIGVADEIVNAEHPDFDTLQAAIDFAESNGYNAVWFGGSGPYEPVTISSNLELRCAQGGPFGTFGNRIRAASDVHGVEVTSSQVLLIGLRVDQETAGNARDGIHVTQGQALVQILRCNVPEADRDGIFTDANSTLVLGCHVDSGGVGRNPVALAGNSQNCVVDGGNVDSVSNAGTGNVVGDLAA